ncbi:type II toxin-antitoxin system PemK/MazF family toxin [Companilactobacillus kedongensis]|uniref:type II toxin-antitoxin system PemK/MazF family toxin n=1 Tax=Companilactobacillus kedongensis TaxID=2486004 RepID=UPI000F7B4C0B|nr:type II toxin-antitoxin system PemK/MazF family toxin [Companilactobacillus kedongensis]
MIFEKGEIYFVTLDPSKGSEPKKTRPCIIVSNNNYNQYFNTCIVVPISSSKKYKTETKYKKSPFFINIKTDKVDGTALLQHVKSIDLTARIDGKVISKLSPSKMNNISNILKEFY